MAQLVRDAAFLDKCEQFLLHPAVRALSLAQRVDFLEQKGLTPEEITQCLRAVQAHNGLAKIAAGSAAAVASTVAATSSSSLSTSKAALLGKLTRKYGAASLLLSLLGYGYLRFRQRLTEQLVVEHVADHVKRRAKRNAQVGALLAVIEHQQSQYKQAAELLERRVASVAKMQNDLLAKQAAAGIGAVEMRKRNEEVHALKATFLILKSQVLEAYVTAPVASTASTVVLSPAPAATSPVKKEIPVAATAVAASPVRPSTNEAASQAGTMLRNTVSVGVQTVAAVARPVAPVVASPVTLMTQPVDVAELLSAVMESEEQASALSYRQLLAAS